MKLLPPVARSLRHDEESPAEQQHEAQRAARRLGGGGSLAASRPLGRQSLSLTNRFSRVWPTVQFPCRPAFMARTYALLLVLASLVAAPLPPPRAANPTMVNGQPAEMLMERLVAWLRANGARFDKVAPVWSGKTGFTLRATAEVQVGECLIEVPLAVLLGPKAVEASWMRSLLAALPVPEQVQVLLLLEDANATSFFRPYLDMLPQTFDTPLFWTREQAMELQGTQLLERSIMLRHEMPRSFHNLKTSVIDKHPGLFPADKFTYDRYLWSYSIVRSRAFGNFTLMPLIDLMNHDPKSRLAPTLMANGEGIAGRMRLRGRHGLIDMP